MKFYPADWRADAMLRLCSISARGLWCEMMCLMHEADPYGSLLVNGKRIDKKQLAGLAGISEKECSALLIELEGNGVFSRDPDGAIFSRRMRRDFEKAARDKANGKGGGNPKLKGGVNPPDNGEDKAQKPESRIDDAGDASAREPSAGVSGKEAHDLAERLLTIAGHDPKFWPPGWCGAPLTVKKWLDAGWQPEIIIAAVTAAASRKTGAPATTAQYFEKAIADEHARQAAPLPKVEIREAQTVTVNHGKAKPQSGGSLISTIRRELASVEAQIADLALPGDAVLSLPHRSVR